MSFIVSTTYHTPRGTFVTHGEGSFDTRDEALTAKEALEYLLAGQKHRELNPLGQRVTSVIVKQTDGSTLVLGDEMLKQSAIITSVIEL